MQADTDVTKVLQTSLLLYVGDKSSEGHNVLWARGNSEQVDTLLERLSPVVLSAYVVALLKGQLQREKDRVDSNEENTCPGVFVIVDLKGFTASSVTSKLVETCATVAEDCQKRYAGRLERLFFVRTPFVFSALWTQLQDGICDSVKDKVTIFRESQTHLLQTVAREQGIRLPEEFGGEAGEQVFAESRLLSRSASCNNALPGMIQATEAHTTTGNRENTLEKSVATIMQAIDEVDRSNPEWMRSLIEYYNQAEVEMLGENANLRAQLAELELQLELLNESKKRRGSRCGGETSLRDTSEGTRSLESLRTELDATLEQAAAYQRTVHFARNYIETESNLSRDEEARYTEEVCALEEDNKYLQALLAETSENQNHD